MVARSVGPSRPRAFLLVTLLQIRFALVSAALLSVTSVLFALTQVFGRTRSA